MKYTMHNINIKHFRTTHQNYGFFNKILIPYDKNVFL